MMQQNRFDHAQAESARIRRADLHLHTTASDGQWTPQQIGEEALSRGLSVIAITDHDTIDGIQPAMAHAPRDVTVIPGVELSTEEDGCEIHVLGYWIDAKDPVLLNLLEQLRNERWQRTKTMVMNLQRLGIDISLDLVTNCAGEGVVGRIHIARALVQTRACSSTNDAFERYLRVGGPGYAPRQKLSPSKAIEVIHDSGGLAIVAHPGLIGREELVKKMVARGLDGIEVVHSSHSLAESKHYSRICALYGLLPTGGSDCHGPGGKDEVLMGRWSIPASWVDALHAKWLTKCPEQATSGSSLTD